jgi:hypothetical protein
VGDGALDHEEAGGAMRRTAWPTALVVALLLVGGAVAASRRGPATPPPDAGPTVRSSAWYCPHGGGEGWEGTLALASTDDSPVEVRITTLDDRAPGAPEVVEVPPGRTLVRPLEVSSASSATVVETFDGFVGAGYRLVAGGDDAGFGAEPCLPAAAARWWVSGLSTAKGDRASLVVANPFRSQAVFDIVLFTPDGAPLRDPTWTDVRLAPGRSASFNVSGKVPGKAAVTAVVEGSLGRTAVGSVTIAESGGVRSMVGTAAQAVRWFVPVAAGSGQSSVGVGVTGEDAVRFSAAIRGETGPATAGGVLGVRQGAASASAYQLTTPGPSTIDLTADRPVTVGLGALGSTADHAASAGMAVPATAWLVPPTVGREPWFPGLVVGNPGDSEVQVELVTLPTDDGIAPATASFDIPAGATAVPPSSFLESDPTAMILVRASGPVVAAGASTSSGLEGVAWYALANGVAVPAWAIGSA